MKIELLSPAKNLEIGMAAINAGADAVYIGVYKFGARKKASNSLEDIEKLTKYAHKFNVKVYVVLNTILYNKELKEVQTIIDKLYAFKIDAIIIQDMGILELDLHDIPVIASTQMDNLELEKIKFLEKIGFKRVILGREASLPQIKEIKKNTKIELETFVHGALCVCFSGHCYFSQHLAKRSANRGECLQPCRLKYSLVDSENNVLIEDKYLLSLKDFNLSENLEELIDAGVTSFKIEGRLKDIDYVSNVTYFYRKKIDEILKKRKNFEKSSYGNIFSEIKPDLSKTFNRGFTDYFLKDRQKDILAINSPKSIGKFIGKVKKITKKYFILDKNIEINCGDGLCFFNKKGELKGSNVIKFENGKIFLNKIEGLNLSDKVYRNFDIDFDKKIRKKDAFKRKIGLSFNLKETQSGLFALVKDDSGESVSLEIEISKIKAENFELALENIRNQFSKLGNTCFYAKDIKASFYKEPLFINLSVLNDLRRKLVLKIEQEKSYKNEKKVLKKEDRTEFYIKKLSSDFNVSNKLASAFYKKHGVLEIEPAFEIKETDLLMTTKHCLKHYLGFCKKQGLKEPLYLVNEKKQRFLLKFDCKNCQMKVYKDSV